ncbi:hypothetical protein ABL78_0746 [Leptomonas seymouri]|uniref:Uncharacterized protein n=1 Tax=Leptomonas seymouri TaxID=5684 RepID=A0A0N1IBI8_LEPSE|nr:hypothetical protein ABL78_0746 [Leptomonas seymouri]|eukprot:KPI90101.1 hypothetical protein ABL78_0746 [Leptomonas seymouri]
MPTEPAQTGYPDFLTEEQKTLLAQFELRTISASDDTPVIVVGRSCMRYTEEASASSSCSSRASTMSLHQAESGSAALNTKSRAILESSLPDVAPSVSLNPNTAICASPSQDNPKTRLLAEEKVHLLQDAAVGGGSSDLPAPDVCNLYVTSAAPLLHIDTGSTDASRSELQLQRNASHNALAFNMATTDMEAENRKSLDERCQEMAERLVRLSAEVDAVAFRMDHSVPPPSEFL